MTRRARVSAAPTRRSTPGACVSTASSIACWLVNRMLARAFGVLAREEAARQREELLACEHQAGPDVDIARRRGYAGIRARQMSSAALVCRGRHALRAVLGALGGRVALDRRIRPIYSICRPHVPCPRLRFSSSVGSSTWSALPVYRTTRSGSIWRTASSGTRLLKEPMRTRASFKK